MTMIQVPNEPEYIEELPSQHYRPEPEGETHRDLAMDMLKQATPGISDLLVKVAGEIAGELLGKFFGGGGGSPMGERQPAQGQVIDVPALPEGIRPPIGFIPRAKQGAIQAASIPAQTKQTTMPEPQGETVMSQPLSTTNERVSKSEIAAALQDVYLAAEGFGLDKTLGEAITAARMFEDAIIDMVYEKLEGGEYVAATPDVIEDWETEVESLEPETTVVPAGDC